MAIGIGYLGQVKGPFNNGENIFSTRVLLPEGCKIKFGISIDPYDLLIRPEWGFRVNERYIKMGKTGMYEIDEPMIVSSLTFPEGAPASILVEFVIYE